MAVSLVLAVSSIIGAGCHAGVHHHQAGSHHHKIAASENSPKADHLATHSGDERALFGAGDANVPEPAHQHSGCMDFICHGGLAVLASATSWIVAGWPEKAVLPRDMQALVSVSPARLDRPPKSFVSA
jgi:hypothetical protein